MDNPRSENAENPSSKPSPTISVDFGFGVRIDVKRLSVCACSHDSCWVRRGDPWHESCNCPKEDGWMELRLFEDDDWDTSRQVLLESGDMVAAVGQLNDAVRQVVSGDE